MNPALASTVDFQKFVQEPLLASKNAYVNRFGTKRTGTEAPKSKIAGRSSRNESTRLDDQPFFITNSAKYNPDTVRRPQSAGPTRRAQSNVDTSSSPKFNFTHSWKAHLDYKRPISPAALKIPLPHVDEGEEASPTRPRPLNIVQSPFRGVLRAALEPSPRRYKEGGSLFALDDEGLSPRPSLLRTKSLVSNPLECAPSPSSLRYRRKVLSRHLLKWKAFIQYNSKRLDSLGARCEHNHRLHQLRVVWRDWRNTVAAIYFEERYARYRAKRFLKLWRARSRRKHATLFRGEHHWIRRSMHMGLLALMREVLRGRRKRQRSRNAKAGVLFRRRRLLSGMFHYWRLCVKLSINAKHIEEESKERRGKIESLLNNLSSRPPRQPPLQPTKSSIPRTMRVEKEAKSRAAMEGKQKMGASAPYNPSPRRSPPPAPLPPPPPLDLSAPPRGDAAAPSNTPPPPSYSEFVETMPLDSGRSSSSSQQRPEMDAKDRMARTPGSFNDRAQQHKSRLQDLRAQAQARVQLRLQEEQRKKMERMEKENQELLQLREEAKHRQFEEKAKSARTLALNAELQRLLAKAKEFRRRQLLVRCGLAPWRRLVALTREWDEKSFSFYEHLLKSRVFRTLRAYSETVRADRLRTEARLTTKAHIHRKRSLVKNVWNAWRKYRRALRAKSTALQSHFSGHVPLKFAFRAWQLAYHRSLRQHAYRMRDVIRQGDRSLRRYFFSRWRDYHLTQLEEREVERRMESKWAEVQQWLSHK